VCHFGCRLAAGAGQVRAAALTASQCATYDEVKARVMAATGWRDNAATHLATAMITGVVSTTATNPVDVIKTHMFVGACAVQVACCCARLERVGLAMHNLQVWPCTTCSCLPTASAAAHHRPTPGGQKHGSPFACAASIYAAHGLAGFCRGWLANYARLGPQTVMTFLVVEKLRAVAGMAPL
jgi:solute carrier family 25 uncoupling protein 8/9